MQFGGALAKSRVTVAPVSMMKFNDFLKPSMVTSPLKKPLEVVLTGPQYHSAPDGAAGS
jgi:hypothetical protein